MRRLLLLAVLAGSPMLPPAAAQPLPTHEEAAALAWQGQFAAALAAFRERAAANPRDHEARLWIGRLHLWMRNPDRAEPVFRSVLVEDPSNLEAMLGLGEVLLAEGRTREALDLLHRAEGSAAGNPEVLAALGRAHRQNGDISLALAYLERATVVAPTPQNRRALEDARLDHHHQVQSTTFLERFSKAAADETRSADLRINLRLSDRLRATGRGQYHRQFGLTDQRGGLGIEWRWRPDLILATHALVGPDNRVLPEVDTGAELRFARWPAEWVAAYRYVDVFGARVSIPSIGVTWWLNDRTWLRAHYYLSITDYDRRATIVEDHAGVFSAGYRIVPRLAATLGYTRGNDDFETLTPDRIGDFKAHTASAGLYVDLPSLTSFVGLYRRQWRPGGLEVDRLTFGFVQRF
jgi:YaiO family outer membrane protein